MRQLTCRRLVQTGSSSTHPVASTSVAYLWISYLVPAQKECPHGALMGVFRPHRQTGQCGWSVATSLSSPSETSSVVVSPSSSEQSESIIAGTGEAPVTGKSRAVRHMLHSVRSISSLMNVQALQAQPDMVLNLATNRNRKE